MLSKSSRKRTGLARLRTECVGPEDLGDVRTLLVTGEVIVTLPNWRQVLARSEQGVFTDFLCIPVL